MAADGLRLALTTFTVLPVPAGRIDRRTGGAALTWAPLVGAGLGLLTGAVAVGAYVVGAPPLLAGVGGVAAGALATRGLHLDGLADTADGLGVAGVRRDPAGRERALAAMKAPEIGAFGAVTLLLVILAQVVAVTEIAGRAPLPALVACGVAGAAGRLGAAWACRPGLPAARPDGLGALVAGTVPVWRSALLSIAVTALAAAAVPGRPWLGPVAVLAGLLVAAAMVHHVRRRLGGITGDVLGAAVEVATTTTLVLLSIGTGEPG